MKKLLFASVGLLLLVLNSCKNSDKEEKDEEKNTLVNHADSLYNDVIKGHDEGMGGWMHIETRQKQVKAALDSIAKLPAKAKAAAEQLKVKLAEVNTELQLAYEGMDKWMNEINLDSAKGDLAARIKYLEEEKLKVNSVKDAVNNSLRKADSLLKAKF